LNIFVKTASYGLYTVAVLLIALWLLFPADTAKKWLEMRFSQAVPNTSWNFSEIHFNSYVEVVAKSVKVDINGGSDQETSFDIKQFSVRPNWRDFFSGNFESYSYDLEGFGGTVNGTISRGDNNAFNCDTTFSKLQLEEINTTFKELERDLSGELSGSFICEGLSWDLEGVELSGNLTIANGGFNFITPVLGLDQFVFSTIDTLFFYQNSLMKLTEGVVDSRLLSADFSGNLAQAENLLESEIKVSGSLVPRSELFSNSNSNMLTQMIRTQLRDDRLPLFVSGTLREPSILFEQGVIPPQGKHD